jgi:hypothetical protein
MLSTFAGRRIIINLLLSAAGTWYNSVVQVSVMLFGFR